MEQFGAGHERIDRGVLQCDADAATNFVRLLGDVEACDARGSRGRAQQGSEHAHRGALAGAVRPEEPEDLPLVHGEVDAVDGVHVAEVAHEVLGDDGGF